MTLPVNYDQLHHLPPNNGANYTKHYKNCNKVLTLGIECLYLDRE